MTSPPILIPLLSRSEYSQETWLPPAGEKELRASGGLGGDTMT